MNGGVKTITPADARGNWRKWVTSRWLLICMATEKRLTIPDSASALAVHLARTRRWPSGVLTPPLKGQVTPQAGEAASQPSGYCFGGGMVLTMAKLGDDLAGVVSFHGNLNVVPARKETAEGQRAGMSRRGRYVCSQAEVDAFKTDGFHRRRPISSKILSRCGSCFLEPQRHSDG